MDQMDTIEIDFNNGHPFSITFTKGFFKNAIEG